MEARTIRIPKVLADRLEAEAKKLGLPTSTYIKILLGQKIKEERKNK